MSNARSWIELPLAGHGRSLVEASAGTGKTWTIAALYLRLLLEQKLSPRQIVVSTFTKAAAAELGERLRGKLLWALAEAAKHDAAEGREAGEEETRHSDLHWLRQRWRERPETLEPDARRLQSALSEFDAAPIATLHSLCARILSEHPFAAGALFRGREIIDAGSLQRALAEDLWRVIAQGDAEHELVVLAKAAGIDRKQVDRYLPALLQPGVVVAAAEAPLDLRASLGNLDFLQDFNAWADGVVHVADTHTAANARLRRAWHALAQTLRSPQEDPADLLDHLVDYDKVESMTGVKKASKSDPDLLRLIDQTRQIAQALPRLQLDLASPPALRRFLAAAQHWCQTAMQARLDAANQSTFDQLLTVVRDALQPREGRRALADALFEAWPVALVDEFQDTDPVQFGILDAIYRDGEGAPRGRLVMIGDPKQAIYRFRGGDVQAYERAKSEVPAADRLTLDTNFRSSRGYVAAVNQLYAAAGTRLGPAGSDTPIHYEAVQASTRRGDAALNSGGAVPVSRPLVLQVLSGDAALDDLEMHALRCCAGQIVQLLSEDGYRIGEKRLQPGDIAVLLPGHRQIRTLAALLKARGVPCVTGSQASVFDSDTARDLRLILHAALHAEDPRAQRAAVATRLWGGSLRELQPLRHDPAASDAQAGRFHALHAVLEKRGPLGVVGSLLERRAGPLLATREGERMLTDLRHLGELLQEAWQDCGSGERLMGWFADQVEDGGEAADAGDTRALRLESDAARVQLMTLHASKGLEFGVVFLPLMWKHKGHGGKGPALLGDPDTHAKYLVEGPAKEMVKQQEREERFRILYVALTRAIHACHVFLLSPDAKAKEDEKGDAPLNTFPLDALRGSAAEPGSCIACIEGWAEHPELRHARDSGDSQPRQARPLPTPPRGPLPMRHSFSTLSGGGRQRVAEEDGAADDEALEAAIDSATDATVEDAEPAAPAVPQAEPSFHAELDALAQVAGTDFGNAVHALFEHRRPGLELTPEQALAALREHGVRPRKGELEDVGKALAERINRVLKTALAEPEGPRLRDLAAADMRAELEFNYLLDGASLRALRAACEQHGEPGLVPAREQTLAGLMNGKIDLVFAHGGRFHVLDYKGNQLARGARACLEDYAPEALESKMLSSGYRFQALLYTVAVERYLGERLGAAYRRDQHLGDCWYLFIRAVGLHLADGRPCGVWHHRFGDALLDAVQAVLSTRQEAA